VAWAGESGDDEDARLGWWQSDLVSQFGGIALFERLTPRSAQWSAFEAAREAARRADAARRSADADPDRLLSLYHFGFTIDEQLDDRLATLKLEEIPPQTALPALATLPREDWSAEAFAAWLKDAGAGAESKTEREPSGLRLIKPPADPLARARSYATVLAAVAPSAKTGEPYPCPHVRDGAGAR